MSKKIFYFYILFSGIICFFLSHYRDKLSSVLKIYDLPNETKIHSKPIPLFGGIIFIAPLIVYFFLEFFFSDNFSNTFLFDVRIISLKQFTVFMIALLLIFFTGLFDDVYNLKPNTKLFIFSIIIYFFILSNPNIIIRELRFEYFEKIIKFNEFSIFFTLFCFLVSLNSFNMFDGINLQSFLLYLSFILILYFKDLNLNFIIVFLIPLFFFFFYNMRSKMFLGNSGSYFLSFLFSFLIIVNYNFKKNFNVEEIFMYMLIPGIDLIRLFILRILSGKNPFMGDLNHFHHILLGNYGYIKTILIFILLIFLPIFLYNLLNISLLILISFSIILYIILIFNFKKFNVFN